MKSVNSTYFLFMKTHDVIKKENSFPVLSADAHHVMGAASIISRECTLHARISQGEDRAVDQSIF